MQLDNEVVLKLILAVLVGGAIGVERELRSKSAGFRTLMLICLGATLFTIFSRFIGGAATPDRIAISFFCGLNAMAH